MTPLTHVKKINIQNTYMSVIKKNIFTVYVHEDTLNIIQASVNVQS